MKIYVSEKERFKDVQSSAYSFTIMGGIGYALLILLWLDKLPVNMDIPNKIMASVVMGVLFSVFFLVGIKSFLSLSAIKNNASRQENTETDIIDWFFENNKELVSSFNLDSSSEESYFDMYNSISDILTENFSQLKEEENDHITEIIISKLDETNEN